jgi:PAS domain S-box-containing protein
MDLRTKLVFALVAVSLASMLSLGVLAYSAASAKLTQKSLRHLDALAETKKQDLEKVMVGWKDRVSLIASRTQLRLSLRDYNSSRDPARQRQIERILTDARLSSRAVQSLAVYDAEGSPVAWTGQEESGVTGEPLPPAAASADGVTFEHIFFANEAEPRASFVAPLVLDGQRIGALSVVLNAQELIAITLDTAGLGGTGETLIVLRDSSDATRVLGPMRHRSDTQLSPIEPAGPNDPATWAIQGRDTVVTEGLVDYRGEPVWAATRFLGEAGWGLVVKFDAAEERESIQEFRQELAFLGLSLSAFAILLGAILGVRLARPIHALSAVANRIRLGELDARAEASREDELGLLARTFNQMADELEEQMTLLHEFQKYFEVSLDMLCIAGTDGYFKRVNPAFERILGWSEEELLTRPFLDFVHPNDVEATVREIEKLSQGIPTVSFENCYQCADGSYKQLLWNSYPEPETGLLYAIARDVTDLRQMQDRVRAEDDSDSTDRD